MTINKNLADIAGSANTKNADAVGNTDPTDLVQKQHLDAALGADGHNHDGQYLLAETAINDFADVFAAAPADGQILVYRDGSGWVLENVPEPATPAGPRMERVGFSSNGTTNSTISHVLVSADKSTVVFYSTTSTDTYNTGRAEIFERVGASYVSAASFHQPIQPEGDTRTQWVFPQWGEWSVSVAPDGGQVCIVGYDRTLETAEHGSAQYSGSGVWVYNRPVGGWVAWGFAEANQPTTPSAFFHLWEGATVGNLNGSMYITTIRYVPSLINGKYRMFCGGRYQSSGASVVGGPKIIEITPQTDSNTAFTTVMQTGSAEQSECQWDWSEDGSRLLNAGDRSGNVFPQTQTLQWYSIDHVSNTFGPKNSSPDTFTPLAYFGRAFYVSADGNTAILPNYPSNFFSGGSGGANYNEPKGYIYKWDGISNYRLVDTLSYDTDTKYGRNGSSYHYSFNSNNGKTFKIRFPFRAKINEDGTALFISSSGGKDADTDQQIERGEVVEFAKNATADVWEELPRPASVVAPYQPLLAEAANDQYVWQGDAPKDLEFWVDANANFYFK